MRSLSTGLLLGGLLAASGCGKVEPITDAAPIEVDAEDHDAEVSREITIRTRTRGQVADAVAPGIDVVVTEPDGALGTVGQTDDDGELIVEVDPGSSVTAVYVRPDGAELVTFVDVEPGDVITFGRAFPDEDDTALVPTMRIGWPAQVGATSYRVHHPCGLSTGAAADTSIVFNRFAYCAQSPFDVFQTASDAAGLIRWGVQRAVPFVEGSTSTLAAWNPMTTIPLAVTGLPPEVSNASIRVAGTLEAGPSLPSASLSGAPVGGALSGSPPWTTGGDGIRVTVDLQRSADFGGQTLLEPRPGDATSVTVASPAILPWLGALIGNAAAGDSGAVSWIQDGDGTFDLQVLSISWSRAKPTRRYDWTVFLGPGRTSYQLPTMPAALAAHAPADTDSFSYLSGGIIEIPTDDGYDVTRNRGEPGIVGSLGQGDEAIQAANFRSPVNLTSPPRSFRDALIAR